MSQPPVPPLMMLRSFLTIASGYIVCMLLLFGITSAVGYALFPEFIAFLNLDPAAQEALMADDPSKAIPRAMFWLVVGLHTIVCFGIGWLVIKTAPFAQFAHAVFLSVFLFISYLQISIADPVPKKSMTIVYMFVFPIAIFVGAKWAFGRNAQVEDVIEIREELEQSD